MDPDFSIVTVCLNEAGKIGRTCESIVSQSHGSREWIVIDGASTDGTLDILEQHRSSIDHLISESDEGLYHAMNKGLALAKGEYVVFMNGGDAFADQEVLAVVSAEMGADLIYGDVHLESTGKDVSHPDQLPPGYLLNASLPHQASYYKNGILRKVGGYDTSFTIAADYDLNVRLLEVEGASHHHIKKPLALFDPDGISSDPMHRKLRKRENHEIRMKYFPPYRWSPKALRQTIRNLFSS
jgi:glycosyltransferase involved in cell wall biosynthesis